VNRRTLKVGSILVTGAARGTGTEVARLAATRGARVALVTSHPTKPKPNTTINWIPATGRIAER
jgi:NAD(P)-dependent dehydrogenase (short-subunit alcohol dehydrogenase family)